MEIIRPKSKQPIPAHAKCVFKGKIFDVYQWEQEMFDGSRAIFEKLKRPDTVMVFPVLEDGRIMVTKQEQPGKEPFMGAIGGLADEGEGVMDTLKRELLEESGYEAESFVLLDAQHLMSKIDWVDYTFIAKGLKRVAEQNLDGGEKIELQFVTLDELIDLVLAEKFIGTELLYKFAAAKIYPEKMEELRKLFDPNFF